LAYKHTEVVYRDVKVEVFVTLGIETPSCISLETNNSFRNNTGTINVAVIVDKPLSELALLDLFRVVSEVKGAVVALGGPQCTRGLVIGTVSDTIAVVAPEGLERFTGIATDADIAVPRILAKT